MKLLRWTNPPTISNTAIEETPVSKNKEVEVVEEPVIEVTKFVEPVVENKPPEFTNIALGIYKDRKEGLWKVAQIEFNSAGEIGGFKVIYETGFRDEANESFRINVSRLGLLG